MNKAVVQLLLLNHSNLGDNIEFVIDLLQIEQQQKAATLPTKRKKEFSIGRLLLQHALRNQAGAFVIDEQNKGSPNIIFDTPTHTPLFSISHSGNWVGLALSTQLDNAMLGLDIQQIKKDLTSEKAALFCSDEQIAMTKELPEKQQSQFLSKLWSQKEAFFKAQGIGVFNEQTKMVDFSNDPNMHNHLLEDDEHYWLSVYCNHTIEISTQFLQLDKARRQLQPTHQPTLLANTATQLTFT